jgi:hypothetical protein
MNALKTVALVTFSVGSLWHALTMDALVWRLFKSYPDEWQRLGRPASVFGWGGMPDGSEPEDGWLSWSVHTSFAGRAATLGLEAWLLKTPPLLREDPYALRSLLNARVSMALCVSSGVLLWWAW